MDGTEDRRRIANEKFDSCEHISTLGGSVDSQRGFHEYVIVAYGCLLGGGPVERLT